MSADDGKVVEEECTATFTPKVQGLTEVETATGEEDEALLWTHRCALYRFAEDVSGVKMWCERGRGDVRILQHKETQKARLILREDKTRKLRLNSAIVEGIELTPNNGSEKAWTWSCHDHSEGNEGGVMQTFAIRFKNAEVANTFKSHFDMCRDGKFEDLLAALSLETEKENEKQTTEEKDNAKDVDIWNKVLSNKDAKLSEDSLKSLWDEFDKDKSGFIDLEELEKLFSSLVDSFVSKLGNAAVPTQVKALRAHIPVLAKANLAKLDTNNDKKISWDEFLKLEDVALAMIVA